MADINHLLYIDAPPQKVYQALTTQEGLASWWTDETKARPEIDSIAEFKFGDRFHNKMRITKLEADKLVQWECLLGHQEWVGTFLSFKLEGVESGTNLRFCHGNWQEITDFFASCNYNWGYYLSSLNKYCESGQGFPFKSKQI
jgi:uncharacterized protein YndB with AHSA1/START domain